MTYVIEGKLTVRNRPEAYLNQYVHCIRTQVGYTTKTEKIITSSKRLATRLNKKGKQFRLITDIEEAEELCDAEELTVSHSKLFAPRSGWQHYLNETFESSKQEVIGGKVFVWQETSLPTPWLYCVAYGKLIDIFVFEDNEFLAEPKHSSKGTIFSRGIALEARIEASKLWTTKKISTVVYRL